LILPRVIGTTKKKIKELQIVGQSKGPKPTTDPVLGLGPSR
jgi:hypothetical protein